MPTRSSPLARRRRLLCAASALTLFLSSAASADVPCLFNCAFTVNAKKGLYIKTVDATKLAEMRRQQAGDGQNKGAAEHALNRGELAGYGLRMPQTEAKLRVLLDDMAKASTQWTNLSPQPRPPIIHIVATTFYGPAAQPDGSIIVPLGLLMRAKSKDEVAWLMAHEYGHILLAHFARDAAAERRKQMIDGVTDFIVNALDASRIREQSVGQSIHLYAINDPAVVRRQKGAESLQQQVRLAIKLHSQAVSRDQEDWADAAGADMAMAATWDADDGAHDAFTAIAADDERAAKLTQSFNDRLKEIAAQSVSAKAVATAQQMDFSVALNDFANTFGSNLKAYAGSQIVSMMMSSHRPTMQRQKGLHAYIHDAYPGEDRDKELTWIKEIQDTAEFKQALQAVTALDSADELVKADKPEEALAALQPSQATRYANAPFIANMAAKVHVMLGNVDRADQIYDLTEAPPARAKPAAALLAAPTRTRVRAAPRGRPAKPVVVAVPPPPPPPEPDDPFMRQSLTGYTEHIRLLTSHHNFTKAKAKIKEAEDIFHDHEAFLPELIFMALKSNKAEEMQAYVDECRKVQNDTLWENCKIAIYDESQKEALDKLPPDQRERLDHALERKYQDNGRTMMWEHLMESINKAQAPQ